MQQNLGILGLRRPPAPNPHPPIGATANDEKTRGGETEKNNRQFCLPWKYQVLFTRTMAMLMLSRSGESKPSQHVNNQHYSNRIAYDEITKTDNCATTADFPRCVYSYVACVLSR